ncbi:DNA-formamidopyrimidine glycosylase [bacterium]|nr:DNA-formamidopyrimidine glycosylase [bacterium]
MPELPEVETTVLDLKRKVLKRTFLDIWTDAPKLIKKPNLEEFKREIKGKKIQDIKRKGKFIIFYLSGDKRLLIHQKLTGHLLVGQWKKENEEWVPVKKGPLEDPMNKFIHIIFFLDNGLMIAFSDLRKFGRVELLTKKELENLKDLKELGPDPLDKNFTFDRFKQIIQNQKRKIKAVLMDQKLISGIGNIYSDEILFRAGVHPFKPANTLQEREIRKIYRNIKSVLKKAIKLGGESISDYRRPDGRKGGFDKERKVYRREGMPCYVCGTKIERGKINSRSTYFCPKCQKL